MGGYSSNKESMQVFSMKMKKNNKSNTKNKGNFVWIDECVLGVRDGTINRS